MGFDIGKPFSDNALSLLERRREADQQQALALAKLGIDIRQMGGAERTQNRALDLQRLRGEQDNARLDKTQAFEEKKYGAEFDLRRALAAAGLSETSRHHMSQEEIDDARARDMAGYHSGLLDLGEVNALSAADRADSDRRRTAEDEAMGAFRRGPLGQSQIAANESLAGLRGAQTGQAEATTELTKERALQLRENYGLKTGIDFFKGITSLINAYNAAAGNPNGPNKEAMARSLRAMDELRKIAQVTGVDVASLDSHARAMSHQTPFQQVLAGPFVPRPGTGNGTPSDALGALDRYLGGGAPAGGQGDQPQALAPPAPDRGPPDEVKELPDGSTWVRWGQHWEMVPRGQPVPGKPPPTIGR